MTNFIFLIEKISKTKQILSSLLQSVEAINSLPGYLSPFLLKSEEGYQSINSSMMGKNQTGVNILCNMSNLSSQNRKEICNLTNISYDKVEKILQNDTTISQEESKNIISNLNNLQIISNIIQTADENGEGNFESVIPKFVENVNSNINLDNFNIIADRFFSLSESLDTTFGNLVEKLNGSILLTNNIPEQIKNIYNIQNAPQPTETDLLNRNENTYESFTSNVSSENFAKKTGFIYNLTNLQSRIKFMVSYNSLLTTIIKKFI